MKNYFFGFLTCSLIYGSIANAVDIKFETMSVRDLFAASALMGVESRGSAFIGEDAKANYCWKIADQMMRNRK